MTGCNSTGKTSYASRAEASRARDAFLGRLRHKADPLDVYGCSACGGYHLGRNLRKGRKAANRHSPHDTAAAKGRFIRWKALTDGA